MNSASAEPVRSWLRSRNSSTIDGGNFGAEPNPPRRRIEVGPSRATTAPSSSVVVHSGLGESLLLLGERATTCAPARRSPRAGSARRSMTAVSNCGTRASGARGRRVVGAAVERLPIRGEQAGHRPAALTGHRLGGLHVHRVDVRPLLAVDLDVDEVRRSCSAAVPVLERLVRHHMTPVAGGIADREQDRHVALARLVERRSDHGHQSTGLSACWSRYGLVDSASLFVMTPPCQPRGADAPH